METVIDIYRKHLFESQERTVRMTHPEYSEEEVMQRCQELQNIIIENEERPKWASHLGKIWEAKNKFRK